MKPIRLAVLGASGRMGRRVCDLAAEDSRFQVCARLDRKNSKAFDDQADILIDFSLPEASLAAFKWATATRIPVVSGVTGFSSAQLSKIRAFSKKIPIFLASNFSPGVFLMKRLAAMAARELPNYDISIVETHHKMKKDAPSGTARDLASALGRPAPVFSQRIGDVVGDHSVAFAGPFERLEITHRAHSRDLFARGALEAALWIINRKPGLYGMADLFGKMK